MIILFALNGEKNCHKVQLQVLKSQKTIRYPSPKQNPADEQQHKYFNYGMENALCAIGGNNLDFKIILLFLFTYYLWPNVTKSEFWQYF